MTQALARVRAQLSNAERCRRADVVFHRWENDDEGGQAAFFSRVSDVVKARFPPSIFCPPPPGNNNNNNNNNNTRGDGLPPTTGQQQQQQHQPQQPAVTANVPPPPLPQQRGRAAL